MCGSLRYQQEWTSRRGLPQCYQPNASCTRDRLGTFRFQYWNGKCPRETSVSDIEVLSHSVPVNMIYLKYCAKYYKSTSSVKVNEYEYQVAIPNNMRTVLGLPKCLQMIEVV